MSSSLWFRVETMNQPIVFGITGKLGTGKSSLAKALQNYDDSIVIIELDDVRRYALWQSIEPRHIQLRKDLATAFNFPIHGTSSWINRDNFTQTIFSSETNLQLYRSIATPFLQYDVSQKIIDLNKKYALCWTYLFEEKYDFLINSAVIYTQCSQQTIDERMVYDFTDNRLSFDHSIEKPLCNNLSFVVYENDKEEFENLEVLLSMISEKINIKKSNAEIYRQDMSFCKFRIPENAGRVIWEVTNECNYGCKYCIFASTGKKPEGELTTQEIFSALNQLKQENFKHIKFTGGEPFLRPDMIDILKEAQRLDFVFDISTNASKINYPLAEQLAQLNLPYIHVSLDGGVQEDHEAVRGKKSFQPTINGIIYLRQANIDLRAGCVIHKNNENNLLSVATLCSKLGIKNLVFSMMEPVGRLKGKNTLLATKSLPNLINDIEIIKQCYPHMTVSHNLQASQVINFKQSGVSCSAGKQFLFINSLGTVSPCSWISEYREDLVGDQIHHNSLSSILSSSPLKNMRVLADNNPGVCPASIIGQENKTALDASSKSNHAIKFGQFAPIYRFSTENLIYFNDLQVANRKVLTIGGSYDHCIDLVLLGAKEVHNIDVNVCAQYYGNLKKIGLTHFTFEQFNNFFIHGFDYRLFLTIQEYLKQDTKIFFNALYKQYNYDGQAVITSDFFHDNTTITAAYLVNETTYLKAQTKIKNHDFIWHLFNISDIKEDTSLTLYDLILLSNIADYSHKMFRDNHTEQFKEDIVLPLLAHLNKNGILMFGYVFDYFNKLHSDKRNIFNSFPHRMSLYNHIPNYAYQEIIFDSTIKNADHDGICFLIEDCHE